MYALLVNALLSLFCSEFLGHYHDTTATTHDISLNDIDPHDLVNLYTTFFIINSPV